MEDTWCVQTASWNDVKYAYEPEDFSVRRFIKK
jgi:hypothetical protein